MKKEVIYLADRDFLERYLKERASATSEDFLEVKAFFNDKPEPIPGTGAAVDKIYRAENGTAYIKIEGSLSNDGPDAWDRFWGYSGSSYKTIQAAMERAKTDVSVSKVIFEVDSPGGTLDGTDETWQAHRALAAEKPTEVRAGNLLASAAYYISTPAQKILATNPTAEIGSIGVLIATYDWTKWEENYGIKEVVITSSNAPYKHADVATEHGKDVLKERLNALERIFYQRITESRGYDAEHIAEHFGRGGLLVAKDPSPEHEDAIRSGMIDGLTTDTVSTASEDMGETLNDLAFETFEEIIKRFASSAGISEAELLQNFSLSQGNQNTPAPAGKKQEGQMNLSEFLNANPAAAAEIEKIKNDATAARAEKAKAEYAEQVAKVLPIIQSAAYPANIKTLGCNVLAGKEDMSAFVSSVAVYDSNKEAAASADAQKQTEELGSVNAETPNLSTSAVEKEFDAVLQAELDKRRAK